MSILKKLNTQPEIKLNNLIIMKMKIQKKISRKIKINKLQTNQMPKNP